VEPLTLTVDAAPGELAARLPEVVAALLRTDPTSTPRMVREATEALHKAQSEPDWWRWPVGAALTAAARDVAMKRAERVKRRVFEVLGVPELQKSAADDLWLTPERLARLQAAIRDEHLALAVELYGPTVIPADELARLRLEGVLTDLDIEEARGLGVLGVGVPLGHGIHADEAAGELTAEEARDLAEDLAATWDGWDDEPEPEPEPGADPPPPPADPPAGVAPAAPAAPAGAPLTERQRAAQAARLRGGAQIVGLGNRVAADLTTVAIDSTGPEAQKRRRAVAEAIAQGIETGASRSDIRHAVAMALGGDYARDLDRIVKTELHADMQTGQRDALLHEEGPDVRVAVTLSPGACRNCRRLYGGQSFKAADLPLPSVNFRVKAADRVACVPPAHPNCQCHMRWLPMRWGVDSEGRPVPPSKLEKSIEPRPRFVRRHRPK
jgi:hypothetical protein